MNVYLKQYQKNSVETSTPERILILLYDGAINFLNKAKIAIEENNLEDMHNNIMRCEEIILEFMNTLDMDAGGDMAKNLYNLYDFLYRRLVQANLEKDINKVDEVLRHLFDLRTTWNKAIEISNAEKAAGGNHLMDSKSFSGGGYYDRYEKDDDDDDDEDEDEDEE